MTPCRPRSPLSGPCFALVLALGLPEAVLAQQAPSPPARSSAVAADAEDDDEALTGALESALLRERSGVLAPRRWEIEPELSYFYDEPTRGRRRDGFGLAVTARLGLPGAMQAEVRLPYVLNDRQKGLGDSSGIGDVTLGLVKEVLREREGRPGLFAYGFWRTRTGDINREPPTGFGQNALQLGLSASKRQDPVVLAGSVSYLANFGSARLDSGARYDSGNVFGLRLASYLAATPDISLSAGLSLNSSISDRFNGGPIESTSRLNGVLELGTTKVIGRDRFLSVVAGIGVTQAAPRLALSVSLPMRF